MLRMGFDPPRASPGLHLPKSLNQRLQLFGQALTASIARRHHPRPAYFEFEGASRNQVARMSLVFSTAAIQQEPWRGLHSGMDVRGYMPRHREHVQLLTRNMRIFHNRDTTFCPSHCATACEVSLATLSRRLVNSSPKVSRKRS